MVEQGEGGSLILTASGTAIQGAPRGQAYSSTKGGMVSMTLSLAVEMARYKITANAVIPGWVEALQLMPVGSKWELYIPQDLAYGVRGQGPIPPYSVLIFEIELLEIAD